MATKNRKRVSNILLVVSLCIAGLLWAYGSRMAKEVREQEHRNQAWRDIIDYNPSAIVVVNKEGYIVQWRGLDRWSRV